MHITNLNHSKWAGLKFLYILVEGFCINFELFFFFFPLNLNLRWYPSLSKISNRFIENKEKSQINFWKPIKDGNKRDFFPPVIRVGHGPKHNPGLVGQVTALFMNGWASFCIWLGEFIDNNLYFIAVTNNWPPAYLNFANNQVNMIWKFQSSTLTNHQRSFVFYRWWKACILQQKDEDSV